jgi:5-hydroxyisourate hydrolase
VYTTDNGRTTSPLLQNEEFIIGRYELVFAVKAYFTSLGVVLPEPAFLEDIPIRFAIANADEHYHVPLLVSPWAYSTYRGS